MYNFCGNRKFQTSFEMQTSFTFRFFDETPLWCNIPWKSLQFEKYKSQKSLQPTIIMNTALTSVTAKWLNCSYRFHVSNGFVWFTCKLLWTFLMVWVKCRIAAVKKIPLSSWHFCFWVMAKSFLVKPSMKLQCYFCSLQ